MAKYRMRYLDRTGKVVGINDGDYHNDAAALTEASNLLGRYAAIEVSCGDRVVAKVARPVLNQRALRGN